MGKLVSPDSLEPHPTLPQTIPALSEDEYSDLLESIRTFGQQQDIVVDSQNVIIDGHNRWRAAKELGLATVSVFPNHAISAEMAERLGIELNANRRQWTREQRRAAVVRLLKLEPGRSDSAIGKSAGVDHKTVAAVRGELESSWEIPKCEERVGTDGRKQPAKKPRAPRTPKAKKETPEDMASAVVEAAQKNGNGRPGSKVSIEGMTPEEAVRSVADFRASGGSQADAAHMLGVHNDTYMRMERIVALADRNDLTPDDRAAAVAALEDLNTNRQVTPAYRTVEDLFDRVYGDKRTTLAKREEQRLEQFERGFGALIEACSRAAEMDVPYFSAVRAEELVAELDDAARQVRTLQSRIKEFVQ